MKCRATDLAYLDFDRDEFECLATVFECRWSMACWASSSFSVFARLTGRLTAALFKIAQRCHYQDAFKFIFISKSVNRSYAR